VVTEEDRAWAQQVADRYLKEYGKSATVRSVLVDGGEALTLNAEGGTSKQLVLRSENFLVGHRPSTERRIAWWVKQISVP
jgi:hypothetical protein